MDRSNEQIVQLLYKCVNGKKLEEAEQQQLDNWVAASSYNRQVFEEIMNAGLLEKEVKDLARGDKKVLWNKIRKGISGEAKQAPIFSFFRTGIGRYAAAIVVILLCTGVYFAFFRSDKANGAPPETTTTLTQKSDIPPGGNKAILQLADGSKIVLDNAANGTVAQQGGVDIFKKDGQLSYAQSTQQGDPQTAAYNTVITPRGGQYQLVLSDGTKVWLNAGSSIHYPVSFAGDERAVTVAGEAYFEVAKNAQKPFRVKVGDMMVEVLGTHFNINAYEADNSINTTLVEGSVKISKNYKSSLLRPGQQSQVDKSGNIKIVNEVDLDATIAWKNGIFLFRKTDMKAIMRQVAYWYDANVVFEDEIPGYFVGTIPRDVPVSKLLQIFELAGGVHFEIRENTIVVKR